MGSNNTTSIIRFSSGLKHWIINFCTNFVLLTLLVSYSVLEAQQGANANTTNDSRKNGFSDLWGRDGQNWTPSSRLPDFSFAGYDMGDSQIPNFPVRARLGDNGARPNDGRDDSSELQNLINTVATPATIIIPNGVWNINRRVIMDKSNIVLRGENGAEFRMSRSLRSIDGEPMGSRAYAFSDAFFLLGNRISGRAERRITARADKGDNVIVVENGAQFQAGELIEINMTDPRDQSLYLALNGGSQTRAFWQNSEQRCRNDAILSRTDIFRFFSKVVSQSGNRVTLARTLPVEIRTNWTPVINSVNLGNTFRNVGLENLVFRMNGDEFAGHFTLEGSSAIQIIGGINCWVRDVEIIDADNGINLRDCHSSLFESIEFNNDRRTADRNGHHAIWFRQSNDNLISEVDINTRYIHDISVEWQSTQNVFSRCGGLDVNIDHHRAFPYANLFTEMDLGLGTRSFSSSGDLCRGSHSGAYTTYWNIVSDRNNFNDFPFRASMRGNGNVEVQDYNFAHGVGLRSARVNPNSESFGQFIEFTNGERLQNPNLYLAQIAVRFNTNTPPTVNITSPSNNETFTLGETIEMSATAADSDGTIDRITFTGGNTAPQVDPGPPFTRNFTPTTAGTFRILAVARDDYGAETQAFVTVTVVEVNAPPTVNITSPSNNETFTLGETIEMSATATDSDGTIDRITFTGGNTAPQVDPGPPFTRNFTPTTAGTFRILAVARDDDGAETQASVTVTVVEANVPPTVNITSPSNNETFILGETIVMSATAMDSDGTIDRIRFTGGNTAPQNDPGPPFTRNFTPTTAGTFRILAVARDDDGAETEAFVTVTVVENQSPTVSITSPSDNETFILGDTINIAADASDVDGTVRRVRFIVNNDTIRFDGTAPYTAEFIPTQPGTYTIMANARDDRDANGDDVIVVTVNENIAPEASFATTFPRSLTLGYTNFSILVNASDAENDDLSLSLSIDGNFIRTESNPPFEWGHVSSNPVTETELLGLGLGDHTLQITVTDSRGASTVISTVVTVTEEGVTVYSPIHDAYIEGNIGINDTVIRLENGRRTSYLQFEIPEIPNDFTLREAILTLTIASDIGNGTISIFNSTDVNWTEENLSSANAPSQEDLLDRISGPFENNVSYQFDVSNFITANNNRVTFILETDGSGADDVSFASKENTAVPAPALRVVLDNVTGVEDSGSIEALAVFPNPSVNGIFELSNSVEWEVIDSNGKSILTGNSNVVNLENSQKGTYFLKVGSGTIKLIHN